MAYTPGVYGRLQSSFGSFALRKENGDDYEPDCLKVMQASLERYLKSKAEIKGVS